MATIAALTIVLAEAGAEPAANPIASLAPFLLIGLAFFFLIIRPQRKRQAAQQSLLKQIEVGDEVITIGGFHGEIMAMTEETVELEIAAGVVVTLARNAISRSLTPAADAQFDADEDFEDDEDVLPGDIPGAQPDAVVAEDDLGDGDGDPGTRSGR